MSTEVKTLTIIPEIAIPEHLLGDIRSKLAYVDELISHVEVRENQILLYLHGDDATLSLARQTLVTEKIQRVILSMTKGAIKPKIQVLEDYCDRSVPYQDDPNLDLIKSGEISQEAVGIYALGPLLSRIIAFFERHFLDLADSFGAVPYRFPTLIPASYMERINYFHAFPHSLTFVTHLREDLDVIDQFAQHAECDEHGLNTHLDSFDRIRALLSPAVCYHLYFSLADRSLPTGQLVATAVGNCFRYESINLTSLERLWNFTMREIIFVGSKDFVLANRETARQRVAKVFEKIGLAYRVESANDPFFVGEFRKQVAYQSAFQLKFEIRARLPFKDSTIAIGSYNYHQDFFGRNLNITLPDGSTAYTGCVAFGLERMAYAFLAQYGLNPTNWPSEVGASLQNKLAAE